MPAPVVYQIPMATRFRGISAREGMLLPGPAGWAEWSPFWDYSGAQLHPWLRAALELRELGLPKPVRELVAVNVTVPAVAAEQAWQIARESGCATAKVKVGDGASLARLEAVRDALGPEGKLRLDANGAWSVDEAFANLREYARFGLEYAEQPCARVEELAELRLRLARSGVDVPIAADESIRLAPDPLEVVRREAADIAVLKVQPLGGIRACLELYGRLGLPAVVSSALETSVGIAAGLALAGALPELPYACGLNTVKLLAADVVAEPLIASGGCLPVPRALPAPDFSRPWQAPPQTAARWRARLDSIAL
jgi:O-succinylbenzoate synthase